MTKPNPLDGLQQGLTDLTAADGAIARITAARTVRAAAEQLEQAEVKRARDNGTSWSKIGAVYGLTKQGAQQRFGEERRKKSQPKASEPRTSEPKTSEPKTSEPKPAEDTRPDVRRPPPEPSPRTPFWGHDTRSGGSYRSR